MATAIAHRLGFATVDDEVQQLTMRAVAARNIFDCTGTNVLLLVASGDRNQSSEQLIIN